MDHTDFETHLTSKKELSWVARAALPSSPARPRAADAARSSGNRWLRLRYLVVLVVLVWAGWRFWNIEMPQLTTLRHQQQSLQAKLKVLQGQQQSLKRQVQETGNPAYLEQFAGPEYGLAKPGQQLFDVGPTKP